jgi:hypothetical protein
MRVPVIKHYRGVSSVCRSRGRSRGRPAPVDRWQDDAPGGLQRARDLLVHARARHFCRVPWQPSRARGTAWLRAQPGIVAGMAEAGDADYAAEFST